MDGNNEQLTKQALFSDTHFNVLQDLVEFTGLTEEEIIRRIIRKPRTDSISAEGWYDEEYDFYQPKTDSELRWFYIACQSYLFSNARKGVWLPVYQLTKKDEPILDYGAGIGTNILYLCSNGFQASYFELNSIQTRFFEYRMSKRGLKSDPINRFSDVLQNGGVDFFQTVILQHVLEHIPNYPDVLKEIVKALRVGGRIIEESPFSKNNVFEKRKLHLKDKHNLSKVFSDLGMVWEKTEYMKVRYWKKKG